MRAGKKVIVFTPNGFVLQARAKEDDKNRSQIHKSGWEIADFEPLGLKVYGINGWHFLRAESAHVKFKPRLF